MSNIMTQQVMLLKDIRRCGNKLATFLNDMFGSKIICSSVRYMETSINTKHADIQKGVVKFTNNERLKISIFSLGNDDRDCLYEYLIDMKTDNGSITIISDGIDKDIVVITYFGDGSYNKTITIESLAKIPSTEITTQPKEENKDMITKNVKNNIIDGIRIISNSNVTEIHESLRTTFKDKFCKINVKKAIGESDESYNIEKGIVKFSVTEGKLKVVIMDLDDNDNDTFSYIFDDETKLNAIIDISDTVTSKTGVVLISTKDNLVTYIITAETTIPVFGFDNITHPNVNLR